MSTPPTHHVMLGAQGRKWDRVGAAWLWEDGSVSIKLNRGVTLNWYELERAEINLKLFKNEPKDTAVPAAPAPKKGDVVYARRHGGQGVPDDDIPF